MPMPIERVWRARASDGATAYLRHFRDHVLPALSQISGFRSARLLRSAIAADGTVELIVISRWDSLASIEAFAGTDISRAVVAPGARACLTSWGGSVDHFEVLEAPDG